MKAVFQSPISLTLDAFLFMRLYSDSHNFIVVFKFLCKKKNTVKGAEFTVIAKYACIHTEAFEMDNSSIQLFACNSSKTSPAQQRCTLIPIFC